MVDVDAALGEQLLDVAGGQGVPQDQRIATAITSRRNRYPGADNPDLEVLT